MDFLAASAFVDSTPLPAAACAQPFSQRRRVLKSGKAVFQNYSSVVDCTIRELSGSDARLVCKHQQALPDRFGLVLVSSNDIRDAKVTSREGDFVEVEFVGESSKAPMLKN